MPEGTFHTRLSPTMEDEIAQALWYHVLDGDNINTDDVGSLVGRINFVTQRANALLPDTRLELSPLDPLQDYRRSSRILNILLYAFAIPIIGLLLAFIGVVVGLSVESQRNEIAVLRSRGATVGQVVGIALLQAIILGLIALVVGLFASQGIARLIGNTKSFLNFTLDSDLRVIVTRRRCVSAFSPSSSSSSPRWSPRSARPATPSSPTRRNEHVHCGRPGGNAPGSTCCC